MDSTSEQNGTGANTSVPEPEWPGGIGNDGMPLSDPRIVEKLVEELKSQGMFDQIRKDCLAEVDTKPAYQNLRSRVSETVQRFLGRQRWNPSLNKNQLRNQLKQHIQQTPFMEDGVERIVEQVVNPKIKSVIEPEVENLICSYFGVELPNGTESAENENVAGSSSSFTAPTSSSERTVGHKEAHISAKRVAEGRRKSGAQMSEKLSNVSSEDIEMRSAGDFDDDINTTSKSQSKQRLEHPASDTSSPGPGLRGDISPLTPEHDDKHAEHYSASAFGDAFPTATDMPCRVPTGFMPPPPADHSISMQKSRSNTPQMQGNVSPLTPPPRTIRPPSPRTPPLPPKFVQDVLANVNQTVVAESPPPPPPIELPPLPVNEELQLQEEIVPTSKSGARSGKNGSEMSPVSDTEFAEITSPNPVSHDASSHRKAESYHSEETTPPIHSPSSIKEPPLPPKFQMRTDITPPPPPPDRTSPPKPPSPLTSPIGSSPEDMEEPSREFNVAGFSQSVMASDLRTPRQMMQSQFKRAAVSNASGTFTPGDTQSSVSASDISDTDLPDASVGTVSEDNYQESETCRKSKDSAEPEDDLEALEKAKAELQAKLAATNIVDEDELDIPMEDSDGEVHTDDSNDYIKRFREIASGVEVQPQPIDTSDNNAVSNKEPPNPPHNDSSMSPISSEGHTPEPPKLEKQSPDESDVKDDHTEEKMRYMKKEDRDDDDEQRDLSKNTTLYTQSSSTKSVVSPKGSTQNTAKSSSGSSKDSTTKEGHNSKTSARHSQSSYDRQSKHRHSSHTDVSKERRPSHSNSTHQSSSSTDEKPSQHKAKPNSDKHRSSHSHSHNNKHRKDKDRRHSSSKKEHEDRGSTGKSRHDKNTDKKVDKDAKKEMEKKREQKLKNFEEKVNQTYKLKSDKYEAIDMFAPKQLKMAPSFNQKASCIISAANSPSQVAGLKTPPTFGSKTPPGFGQSTTTSISNASSNYFSKDCVTQTKDPDKIKTPSSSIISVSSQIAEKSIHIGKETISNNERKKVERIKEQLRKERERGSVSTSPNTSLKTDTESNEKPRKVFPELPVSKCDGDKIEQHKDDYASTKRRLEEARARKMADIHRKKEIDRIRRKSHSGSVSNSSSGEKINVLLNSTSLIEDTKVPDLGLVEMELKMMEDSRRKKEKRKDKDNIRKDKAKLDRSTNSERRESFNDSEESYLSPVKRAGKRKYSSRDSDDASSSDTEWKQCGLKGQQGLTPMKREARQRKPARKYSTSDYDSDDSPPNSNQVCQTYDKRNDAIKPNGLRIHGLELELQRLSESDLHARAENLLSLDVDIDPLHGFSDSEIKKSMESSQLYRRYLDRVENDMEYISCNESDIDDCLLPQDFYENQDFIYLSGLSSKTGTPKAWRGAKKVAGLLKKMFGGSPKVVHPIPRWLMLKLDRWGLRRHEVELIYEPSKIRNKRIYTETEMDQRYPEKECLKNRYKRLRTLPDTPFEMQHQNITQHASFSDAPAKVIHRRDTVEKNLDEMFSSDPETELEMKEPKRKKLKNGDDETCVKILDINVPLSPTHEPFYGFQEDESCRNEPSKEVNTKIQSSKSIHSLSNISQINSSLLKVDSNGNTFGMSSVFASPVSDFSSDYDDDEIQELPTLQNIDLHNKLPMSVQMNYPMVQYLRQALKNDANVIQELDRLLASSSNATTVHKKVEENMLQLVQQKDKIRKRGSFVHHKETRKGQMGISSSSLYSEGESSVIQSTNVSVLGLHPLPPSPISCSGSLSSNEGCESSTC